MPKSDACCKVERIGYKYSVDFTRGMADLWGAADDQYSLRELRDEFNKAMLRAAMEAAGAGPFEREVTTFHETLTGDETAADVRENARTRLELQGVDVAQVEADFVGYSTIRNHLTECLGQEYRDVSEPEEKPSVADARDRLRRLRNRTNIVTEQLIDSFQRHELLPASEVEVTTDVAIHCQSCGTHLNFEEYIETGCNCEFDPGREREDNHNE